MGKVILNAATGIVYGSFGESPAVLLVVGSFNDRATGTPLARFPEQHFSVFNYDRHKRAKVVIPHRMLSSARSKILKF